MKRMLKVPEKVLHKSGSKAFSLLSSRTFFLSPSSSSSSCKEEMSLVAYEWRVEEAGKLI